MNSLIEFFISLGDDSIFIKDVSLSFIKFSLIPLVLSIFKIKCNKSLNIISIESFWLILFGTNLIQLLLSHFYLLSNYSYIIVGTSLSLILVLLIRSQYHET